MTTTCLLCGYEGSVEDFFWVKPTIENKTVLELQETNRCPNCAFEFRSVKK